MVAKFWGRWWNWTIRFHGMNVLEFSFLGAELVVEQKNRAHLCKFLH